MAGVVLWRCAPDTSGLSTGLMGGSAESPGAAPCQQQIQICLGPTRGSIHHLCRPRAIAHTKSCRTDGPWPADSAACALAVRFP